MADDLCPRCGWVLGTGVAACPACGEPIAERRSGFETVYVPAAAGAPRTVSAVAAAAPETASGSATATSGPGGGYLGKQGAPSPGTAFMREDLAGSGPAEMELKVQPVLTCRGGPTSGRRLNLDGPTTTIGRVGASISVDDPTLSGLHFSIEERGHEFFLRDLGSTNGTFLNGHLVRSAPLESGDEIRAGESVFVFSVLEVIPCD